MRSRPARVPRHEALPDAEHHQEAGLLRLAILDRGAFALQPMFRVLRWLLVAAGRARNADDGCREMVAIYCPALAWQNARPWGVHVSRLRRREILSPTTPAVLHSLTTPDSALPLDNAVQPAADDSSDAEHSEDGWNIVDEYLPV